MISYGGYMSIVDINYVDSYVPDIPDVEDPVDPIITDPEATTFPFFNPFYEADSRPVRPLPDVKLGIGSIFGGDGTINLANIILFMGIVLFMISFIVRR